jgi:hypothetical protein
MHSIASRLRGARRIIALRIYGLPSCVSAPVGLGASYTVRRAIRDAYSKSTVSSFHSRFLTNAHVFRSFGILTISWRHKPGGIEPKGSKNRKLGRKNWTHQPEVASAPCASHLAVVRYHDAPAQYSSDVRHGTMVDAYSIDAFLGILPKVGPAHSSLRTLPHRSSGCRGQLAPCCRAPRGAQDVGAA